MLVGEVAVRPARGSNAGKGDGRWPEEPTARAGAQLGWGDSRQPAACGKLGTCVSRWPSPFISLCPSFLCRRIFLAKFHMLDLNFFFFNISNQEVNL